jgi:hypothetical protein
VNHDVLAFSAGDAVDDRAPQQLDLAVLAREWIGGLVISAGEIGTLRFERRGTDDDARDVIEDRDVEPEHEQAGGCRDHEPDAFVELEVTPLDRLLAEEHLDICGELRALCRRQLRERREPGIEQQALHVFEWLRT